MSQPEGSVADVVGRTIAAHGVRDAFGVIGSGNLVVTNALCSEGAHFHHARHEGGAVCMADGYARTTGRLGICSVHQGPGLTNAITGLTEAAKSRTPLLVLAGDTPAAALTSNFRIDQHDLVTSVGAIAERIHSPATAADDAERARGRALNESRPVVLMLPVDLQQHPAAKTAPHPARAPDLPVSEPSMLAVMEVAERIARAELPAIIAGRGAVLADAGAELEALGERIGAVLATSAPANGLFTGLPYALGISGGFASPLAAELLAQADLVILAGASGNHWTTRHGALLHPDATILQIDADRNAIGRHRTVDHALVGDVHATALALLEELAARDHHATGFRTPATAERIASRRWIDEPYDDATTGEFIDPRTLSIELDRRLPADRAVAVDSGHFLGYPSMYLGVPHARAWIFPNGFQSVGLGLGNAIGAAIADPERLTVAAIGDGGAFMALPELETAARLKLDRLLVVIYDDAAYGAEVHHFAPLGHDVSNVRFPEADLAAIAQAAGARGHTVRSPTDLDVIEDWLEERRGHPLVLDAKVNPTICAEWLQEAFRAG